MTSPDAVTLITFPPSLDSEFARFLLSHYSIPHREERHALIFSSFATLRRGRTPRFPLVYGPSVRADTIPKIIGHYEPSAHPEQKLLGGASDVAELPDWRLFHSTLGTATTVFAYYHLLPHRSIMVGPLSDGAPPCEVAAVRRGYPVFATLLRALLRLTASREREAAGTIRAVMQGVDDRLGDGRSYLTGDRFTVADMSFAVAAAPVVWPDEYGGAVPPFVDLPAALREMIDEMRVRPSGQHALRMYREFRRPSPGPPSA